MVEWTPIGTVRSVNPARREWRVAVAPGRNHQFEDMPWVHVRLAGEVLRFKSARIRLSGDTAIIELVRGVTHETVARCRGGSVVIRPDERRLPPDGVPAIDDLVEMELLDEQGATLGKVEDVFGTPAGPVVSVSRPAGGDFMLHLTAAIIAGVDLDQARVTLNASYLEQMVEDADGGDRDDEGEDDAD